MSLTLHAPTTALVLIDLQYGIVGLDLAPRPGSAVVAQAAKLARAFRLARSTVVLVTVGNLPDGRDALRPVADAMPPAAGARPSNWSTVVAELDADADDIRIVKRQWGAFYGTELDLQLRRRGVGTLVLGGIATHIGVESTARDAFERGYQQVFVEDAMAGPSARAHDNTLEFVFPRIGRTRSTEQVIAALQAAPA